MTATRDAPLRVAAARGSAQVSKVPHLPGLDGMRALAVVAVMVYHANSDWLSGGFLGVEVFFVISGYLITLLLIGEHERSGRIDLKAFWLRRARRLLPALFVMLALLMTYTALFKRNELGLLRGDVLAGVGYVSNWYQIWVGQGYTASGAWAPLRHLWSLAVEEQFYLVWPLIMAGLLHLGRRRLPDISRWLVLAALVIAIVMGLAFYPGHDLTAPSAYWHVGGHQFSKTDTLYLSTITRATGLLIGSAFAMIWRPAAVIRGPLRTKGLALDAMAMVGVVTLGLLMWRLHLSTPDGADPWLFRGGFVMVGVATVLVIAAVTHRGAATGPVLGNPVLSWVGTRSYGLYLYHWPIYQIIRKVAGNHLNLMQFVFAMAITATITEASYRFVETPIRRQQVGVMLLRLQHATDEQSRRLVAGAAAMTIALVGFSGVSLATAGLRESEFDRTQDAGALAVTNFDTTTLAPAPAPATTLALVTTTVPVVDPAAPTSAAPSTVAPTTTAPAAAPVTTTPAADGDYPLFAVGDSVMEGAAPDLQNAGFVVDAHRSRQLVDYLPTMEQLASSGRLTGTVVVHLGTNGGFDEDDMMDFFAALQSVPRVIAITDHASRSWISSNNSLIVSLPSRFPNVQVLYWDDLVASCPGNCLYEDGIHLRPDGMTYYTQLIMGLING